MNLPFPSLLQELRDYQPNPGGRALRVYYKCLVRHPKIAVRIKAKYGSTFPKHDSVVAARFAHIIQLSKA